MVATAQLLLDRPINCDRPRPTPGYARDVPSGDLHVIDSVDAAFARGDDDALRQAYDAHGSLIYTFCSRSLPADRAKEVTQDVFVSAWKGRERFDPAKGTLAGWLTGIAKHRIVDNHRSEQRHSQRRADSEPADVPVESEIGEIGDRMLVTEALNALPDRVRQAIELSYFHGYTHAEIADHTGVALGTVKSDIRRGLGRIRTWIGANDD